MIGAMTSFRSARAARAALIGAAVLATAPAWAASLPLKRGDFIVEGEPCQPASSASRLWYDGKGVGASRIECRVRAISRSAGVTLIKQRCAYDDGDRINFDVEMIDAEHLRWNGDVYRHCPRP